MSNIGANIHEIYVLFKEAKEYNINYSKYIQKYSTTERVGEEDVTTVHKVTGISWEIDYKSYPSTNFKFEFDNTENKTIIMPFINYNEICMKRYRVSSSILGKIDFDNLYNIYGIELSSQDPNFLNNNTSIHIPLNKTHGFTPLMYVLSKVEKHIIIDPSKLTGDGSKSTTLSFVANNKQND